MVTLKADMKVGEAVPLPGGKQAKLVDLYAGQNKVYRSHGIGRFEIEIADAR
jgi:argininosuccinate synthase